MRLPGLDVVELPMCLTSFPGSGSYVHRIGRTGRAGKPGNTFVTPRGMNQLRRIENDKRKIARRPIPTLTEAIEGRRWQWKIVTGLGYPDGIGRYKAAENLLEKPTPYCCWQRLKLLTKAYFPVQLAEQPPYRRRKRFSRAGTWVVSSKTSA